MDSCGRGHRRRFGLVVLAAAAAALIVLVPSALGGISGAISTTDDAGGTLCVHGSVVNCNTYAAKKDVYLSGLQNLGDGTYFFAVSVPGAAGPGDGDPNNLSVSDGPYTTREFVISGHHVVIPSSSTHSQDPTTGEIQLWPFDDTTNHGGVYQLSVCAVNGDGTADTTNCKNDNFKVKPSTPCTTDCGGGGFAGDLQAVKTANGAFTRSFTWHIAKAVDSTTITQYNGQSVATAHYTVTVNPSGSSDGSYGVTGAITVSNPNTNPSAPPADDVTGVVVTDAIDNELNATCTVTDGSANGNPPFTVDPTNATIPEGGSITFPYSCSYTAAPAASQQTNTATISWDDQTLGDGTFLGGNTIPAQAGIDWTQVVPTLSDDCIDVTDDVYGGTLSSGVCVDASSHLLGTGTVGTGVTGILKPPSGPPFTSLDLKYSHTFPTPALNTCAPPVTNTAKFTTDDTKTTGTAQQTVTVCNYRALTIGYWGNHLANSNKNGPSYDSYCAHPINGTGCSSNSPWTITNLPQHIGPFNVNTVTLAAKIIAANNCSNASTSAQNAIACLAAQLLAAELNVNGASPAPCIVAVAHGINDANSWLNGGTVDSVAGITYAGPPPASYSLTSAQRAEALVLKNELVKFNQGGGC